VECADKVHNSKNDINPPRSSKPSSFSSCSNQRRSNANSRIREKEDPMEGFQNHAKNLSFIIAIKNNYMFLSMKRIFFLFILKKDSFSEKKILEV